MVVRDNLHADEHIKQEHLQIEYEEQKVASIVQAYTISDPGTVVVHREDTLLAH
jgi:hypothetical protein